MEHVIEQLENLDQQLLEPIPEVVYEQLQPDHAKNCKAQLNNVPKNNDFVNKYVFGGLKAGLKAKKISEDMKEEDIDRAQSYYNTLSRSKKYGLLGFFLILVLLLSLVAWQHSTTKVNLPSLQLEGDIGQIRTGYVSNFPQCYLGPYEKGYSLTENDCSFQKIDYNISEDEITIRIPTTKTEIRFCFQCNFYIFCVLVYVVPDHSEISMNEMVRLELERILQGNGRVTMAQINDGRERNVSITIHPHTEEKKPIDNINEESRFRNQQREPSPKVEIEKLSPFFAVCGFLIVFMLCLLVLFSIVGGIFLFFSGFCAGCCTGCCLRFV